MKKTLMLMTVAALAAGAACAQNAGGDNSGCPAGKKWDRESGRAGWNQMDKRGDRPDGPVDAETMQKMRAIHEEIRDLAGAARVETDEAKKAEIVARLRAKLGEVADLMQAKQEQRLAQAEERLAGLKERIEYAKTHREEMLDEQVQRVLSGEKPQRPDAFKQFPHAKGGMRGDRGDWNRDEMAPPPGAEGADELAPPPPEEMPDDLPPPPAE